MKSTYFFLFLALTFITCTPKTAEKMETIAPEKPVETIAEEPSEPLSPCDNWLTAANREDLISAHVLYKDNLKLIRSLKRRDAVANETRINELYKEGFDYWKKAFEGAPAADGKRPDHFDDGIKFYEHFYNIATSMAEKEAAVNETMNIYKERAKCQGDLAYSMGAMAFDYYYKYPDMKEEEEKYTYFKDAMDLYQDSADYFILNPFTAILSNMVVAEKIPMEEGQKYVRMIKASLKNGLAGAETEAQKEPWLIVNDYVPGLLEQLEGLQGFYDCDYYKEKYLQEWQADPTNCDAISRMIRKLKWAGCPDSDTDLLTVRKAKADNCKKPVITPTATCRSKLQDGDYNGAIVCYEEKANSNTDPIKRAQYNLVVAKIYYGELKRFAEARKYARKAIKDNSTWGDPYILIGKLYASSGPLCGPGRGFDSQRVTWPAIDKWKKAKSVDPSVATEANKLIGQYRKYMPSVEDLFQRGLKEGDSYKVPCWIQESTIVRPAPRS